MYWVDAYPSLLSGQRIRRESWKIAEKYLQYNLNDKRIYVNKKHKLKPWNSDYDDLVNANDWVVL